LQIVIERSDLMQQIGRAAVSASWIAPAAGRQNIA
jgi:hypothetical protein